MYIKNIKMKKKIKLKKKYFVLFEAQEENIRSSFCSKCNVYLCAAWQPTCPPAHLQYAFYGFAT